MTDDAELTELDNNSKRTPRIIILITTLLYISSLLLTVSLYLSSQRDNLSTFHYMSLNNRDILYKCNSIVIYIFYFMIILLRLLLFVLIVKDDPSIKEIINIREIYLFVFNDLLYISLLLVSTLADNTSNIIITILICILVVDLLSNIFLYSKFKNLKDSSWKIYFCFYIFVIIRFVFGFYQITNAISYYLYNLFLYSDSSLEIFLILSNCIQCIIGILLLTYFLDIFFLIFFILLEIGLVVTKGISKPKIYTYIALSSFSFLTILYFILKYRTKILWNMSNNKEDQKFTGMIVMDENTKRGSSFLYGSSNN